MRDIVERTERIVTDSWMQTFTGKAFNIFDPQEGSVCIEDIAHALSMRCRFNGHCKRFYSVAEHSTLMARAHKIATHHPIMREITECDQRGLLMHDITEAYLPDVVRPIKSHLQIWTPQGIESFKEFEVGLLHDLLRLLQLDKHACATGPVIQEIDGAMLATEAVNRELLSEPEERWGLLPDPLDVKIQFWCPGEAEGQFLHEFHKLFIRTP